MVDFKKLNFGSTVDGDKVLEVLQGQFTYSYSTADAGGLFEIDNPQPGNLFLPLSFFSMDGGTTWFGDMEGDFVNGYVDMLTCVTTSKIRYRWNSYGPAGSFPIMYRTALLAMDV